MTDDDKFAAREQFHRVMAAADHIDPSRRDARSLTYVNRAIDAAALAAFAAGVREGRERAAKRCDQWAEDWPYDPPRRFVAQECAAAIRAQVTE